MTDDALGAPPDQKKPSIAAVMAALERESKGQSQTLHSTIVYGLSDLGAEDLRRLQPLWMDLPAAYKSQALRQLNESSEVAFELNFRDIALLSLDDDSASVRAAGIDLLWIDETVATMRRFLELAGADPSAQVRERALVGLARFILLGEYGDIPPEDAKSAQNLALAIHLDESENAELRDRALEALANSSHPQVPGLIERAYDSGSHVSQVSAIFAMGRSCDARWAGILLDELQGSDSERVYEAIQAAGQIQLTQSLQPISELALSDDREIQLMAVWALGEIGGSRAFQILSRLQEATEDDELLDAIEHALDAASFSLSSSPLDVGFDQD